MHDGLEVVGRAIVGDHRAVHTGGEVSLGLGRGVLLVVALGARVRLRLGPGGLEVVVSSSNLSRHCKYDI